MLDHTRNSQESSVLVLNVSMVDDEPTCHNNLMVIGCDPNKIKEIALTLHSVGVVNSLTKADFKKKSKTLYDECPKALIRKVIDIEVAYIHGETPDLLFKVKNLIAFSSQAGYSMFSSKATEMFQCIASNRESSFNEILSLLRSAAISIAKS